MLDSTQLAYLRQGPWIGSPLDVSGVQTGEGFHSSIEVLNLAHPAGGSASIPPTGLFDLSSPNGIMGLSWSPDGQYLLYLSDAVTAASLGNGTASTGCWTPRLLPVAGGPAVALDGVCYLTRTALPQWSPDSRYLLFSAEAGLVTVNVPQALANGGHAQPLFLPVPTDLPGLAHSPTWQPVP